MRIRRLGLHARDAHVAAWTCQATSAAAAARAPPLEQCRALQKVMTCSHWQAAPWRSCPHQTAVQHRQRSRRAPRPHARAHLRTRASGAGQVAAQELQPLPPPPAFDFRSEVTAGTRRVVHERFPQLGDLVEDGTLVAWPRPATYQERREDGYQEPELLLLVGTAHFSARSARDVQRVVAAARPDVVVVELCRSRSAIMADAPSAPATPPAHASGTTPPPARPPLPAPPGGAAPLAAAAVGAVAGGGAAPGVGLLSLSDAGGGEGGGGGGVLRMLSALRRSAALGGQSGLLLRLLLAALSRRTAGALGVEGGGEFVAARRAAEEVGAQVVLGDRPIEITLQRAWGALGARQRLRLCWDLLRASLTASSQALDAELVERLRRDDALSSLLAAWSARYPELLAPLVHERDWYLTWSLKRSKAVSGAKVVVGVVGAGHLRGVVHALVTDQGGDRLRFTELVGGLNRQSEKRAQAARAAARLLVELLLASAALWAWQAWSQGQA